jgi:transketolase
MTLTRLDRRSKDLRRDIIEMVRVSRRGHIGPAFSIIEVLRVLYDEILQYSPRDPRWRKRDRLILSKGHGCLALYAVLAEKGFFSREELMKFCQPDGILGGHPEFGKIPGVEASTGSLGHGLSIGVGFALAAKCDEASHRVFVILGDGECNEGSVWEAALSAAHHKLNSLCVIVDYNKLQSYGAVSEVAALEPFAEKWRSFGFSTKELDGHDLHALREALSFTPPEGHAPTALICHTVKGRGVMSAENNLEWHHKNKIGDAEIEVLLRELEAD